MWLALGGYLDFQDSRDRNYIPSFQAVSLGISQRLGWRKNFWEPPVHIRYFQEQSSKPSEDGQDGACGNNASQLFPFSKSCCLAPHLFWNWMILIQVCACRSQNWLVRVKIQYTQIVGWSLPQIDKIPGSDGLWILNIWPISKHRHAWWYVLTCCHPSPPFPAGVWWPFSLWVQVAPAGWGNSGRRSCDVEFPRARP